MIAALGVLAPPSFDLRVFVEFSRLLADEEPAIRARTISAIVYPSWPEFVPLLEAMASDEPHDEVRSRASVALAAFRQHLSGATVSAICSASCRSDPRAAPSSSFRPASRSPTTTFPDVAPNRRFGHDAIDRTATFLFL